MFRRKAYDKLLAWKREYNGKYACLLEGARRVGKTTIAEEFARNEYKSKNKLIPIEVKSSAVKNHESIDQFNEKYSAYVLDRYLFSQKDVGRIGTLKLKPLYMVPFVLNDLARH